MTFEGRRIVAESIAESIKTEGLLPMGACDPASRE